MEARGVRCRFCGELLMLNPDNEAARVAGTDPHQQLRRHLAALHGQQMAHHARAFGWLLDMLAFDGVDPAWWRERIAAVIDATLKAQG